MFTTCTRYSKSQNVLFIYLQNFYHDTEKAKEKIDTLRDSTTERGSTLSAPGPNKFNYLR